MAPHFSRPVYEGLPWFYIIFGLAVLGLSYFTSGRPFLSHSLGLAGLLSVLGGIVVLLRRRDYRALRSQYGNPDSLTGGDEH
jgi:hypothetical protein